MTRHCLGERQDINTMNVMNETNNTLVWGKIHLVDTSLWGICPFGFSWFRRTGCGSGGQFLVFRAPNQ